MRRLTVVLMVTWFAMVAGSTGLLLYLSHKTTFMAGVQYCAKTMQTPSTDATRATENWLTGESL